jgi:hypothetical protein
MLYALWIPISLLVGIMIFMGVKFDVRLKAIENVPTWPSYPPVRVSGYKLIAGKP